VLTRNYYGPCAGDWFYDNGKYRGVFTYHADGNGIRLTDIHDGTSNTLMFGETAGSNILFDGAPSSLSSSLSVATGGCYITDGFDNGSDFLLPNFETEHFGSRHTGIIHFAFADGSVRAVKNGGSLNGGPRFQMMLRLGGINDGEVTTTTE
jgi:prepilin-type processing-associated H-X9-DG protein